MLHTISTSIQSSINLELISCNDVVLFWQNGVTIALKNDGLLEHILAKTQQCYVLNNDIVARGLTDLVDSRVQIIDMIQAVELTATYSPQINWGN